MVKLTGGLGHIPVAMAFIHRVQVVIARKGPPANDISIFFITRMQPHGLWRGRPKDGSLSN